MANPQENCEHMLQKISHLKKCQYCDAIFPSDEKRRQHVNEIHLMKSKDLKQTQTKDVLCFQCGKSFVSNKSLALHERNVHSVEPKMHKCGKCDKTFLTFSKLEKHIETGIQLCQLFVFIVYLAWKNLFLL